jgi:hypothetical protein
MVIQACRSVDYLSCEIYDYMGQREVTKAHLRKEKKGIMDMMKKKRPDVYGELKFVVVE